MSVALIALGMLGLLLFGGGAILTNSYGTMSPSVDGMNPPTNSDPWTRFDEMFHSYGDIYGVDWTWLKAVALNESDLGRVSSVARGIANPSDVENSKSSDGKSWGLMQVTLTTARGLDASATSEKLNDPDYSIGLGARYIAQLQRMFSTNDSRYPEWVVKSYNQGPGNTMKEAAGVGGGFADEYWARWQRNLTKVETNV